MAREHGSRFVEDLGSGAVADTDSSRRSSTSRPRATLAAGIDLVCFSGDKLLGGPQAGIIAGRRDLVQGSSGNRSTGRSGRTS